MPYRVRGGKWASKFLDSFGNPEISGSAESKNPVDSSTFFTCNNQWHIAPFHYLAVFLGCFALVSTVLNLTSMNKPVSSRGKLVYFRIACFFHVVAAFASNYFLCTKLINCWGLGFLWQTIGSFLVVLMLTQFRYLEKITNKTSYTRHWVILTILITGAIALTALQRGTLSAYSLLHLFFHSLLFFFTVAISYFRYLRDFSTVRNIIVLLELLVEEYQQTGTMTLDQEVIEVLSNQFEVHEYEVNTDLVMEIWARTQNLDTLSNPTLALQEMTDCAKSKHQNKNASIKMNNLGVLANPDWIKNQI